MTTSAPAPAPAPIQAEVVSDLAEAPAPSDEHPGGTARRILDGISDACCELDRRLSGHRWLAVFVVSIVGMLLGVLHSLDVLPAWPYAVLLGLFVLLLTMLAWARIAGIRFEAGDKGWTTAIRGGFAGLAELCRSDDGDEAADELPESQRNANQRRVWMQRLFSASVVFYMLAGLIGLVPSLANRAGIAQAGAVFTFAVSLALWLRGRQVDQQTGQARKYTTLSTEATEAEFLSLPPVLELKKSTVAEIAIVQRSSDDLLRELLIQLPSWRPGKRGHESAYQAALVKFLRKRFPGVEIDEQVPVTPRLRRSMARSWTTVPACVRIGA